jgi:hypothetical protein
MLGPNTLFALARLLGQYEYGEAAATAALPTAGHSSAHFSDSTSTSTRSVYRARLPVDSPPPPGDAARGPPMTQPRTRTRLGGAPPLNVSSISPANDPGTSPACTTRHTPNLVIEHSNLPATLSLLTAASTSPRPTLTNVTFTRASVLPPTGNAPRSSTVGSTETVTGTNPSITQRVRVPPGSAGAPSSSRKAPSSMGLATMDNKYVSSDSFQTSLTTPGGTHAPISKRPT